MQHEDAILPCPYITMLYWHTNMPGRDIIIPHPSIMRSYCVIGRVSLVDLLGDLTRYATSGSTWLSR